MMPLKSNAPVPIEPSKKEWVPFQEGRAKTGGRKKGVPNLKTLAIKTSIENIYEGLGGDSALVEFARKNPGEFYTKIWIKLLPKDVSLHAKIETVPTLTNDQAFSLMKKLQLKANPK